jgi:hypothetical protein
METIAMEDNFDPAQQSDQSEEGAGDSTQPEQPEVSKDAKNFGMLCHLLGLLTNFLGPLILWIVKKDDDPFIDDQGKEALNFQITMMIAGIVGSITTVICIGFVILAAAGVCDIVFSIIACIKASEGVAYRYPVCLRLVK